ncbi:MAG: glycogen synthase GlgA [Spirochaetia bacterium]|nr:glycogen synthase GlgA [Spirochaetia bacterium]
MAERKLSKPHKQRVIKILIAASEVVPFAKTGGLADVTGALPKALRNLGHDVRVVMPLYRKIDREKYGIKDTGKRVNINIALHDHEGAVMEGVLPGSDVPVYFINNREFFDREEIYRTPQGEYWDNNERFMFFSKCIPEMIKAAGWVPDVINCNDWHTGLIPVFLKTIYANDDMLKNIATAYSIHNIAYQGCASKEMISHAGLPWEIYNMHQLEFYGGINYMKGGIVFADVINTVSNKYKEEIKTPEYSYNLDGVLRGRDKDLYGILNGIDYTVWDPATDRFLPVNYTPETIEGKTEVKKKLLEECGLKYKENVPVIGLVSRLDDQKGLDFIANIMEEMMKLNLQFVILGTGEENYHRMFHFFRDRYPEKIAANIKFDNGLAHRIYAGSDMFLMPSRFEPCGLGQLISLKYGTVPIVRETGGLADTIKHFNFKEKKGNGFTFQGYNPWDLFRAIRVAVDTFKNRAVWEKLMHNGMKENFSWDMAAVKYVELYDAAMHNKNLQNA